MANSNQITEELSLLLGADENDIEKYNNIINHCVECVKAKLKNKDDSEDSGIIHLCAVKAYYQIVLMQEDEISSFSAGDVSYSKNSSAVDKAEKLLKAAEKDCCTLLKCSDFAFKVV